MPNSELHHRCHEEVQNYWEKLRAGREFPTENEIDPDELGEYWPSCFLVSIDDVTDRLGYRYSYLGYDLMAAYGEDSAAPDIAMRLLSTRDMPLVKQLESVRNLKIPIIDQNEFSNARNVKVRYRACMLPLGNNPRSVTHILGCMRWKLY